MKKEILKKILLNGIPRILTIVTIIFSIFFLLKPEISSGIVSNYYSHHSLKHDKELRSIAIDLTRDCKNMGEIERKNCYLGNLVDFFNDFNYVEGVKVYSPEETIQNKAGDCVDLSYAFAKLYYQINGDVEVECNEVHCWDVIQINNNTLVYDATTDLLTPREDYLKYYG